MLGRAEALADLAPSTGRKVRAPGPGQEVLCATHPTFQPTLPALGFLLLLKQGAQTEWLKTTLICCAVLEDRGPKWVSLASNQGVCRVAPRRLQGRISLFSGF